MSSKNENSFMYYPELTSPTFNEHIYLKNEFRSNEIKHEVNLNKNIKKNEKKITEFELEPHQNFLRNYINPDTPYNGILIFHGTGVGKTCSAISIAEGFKKTLKNINKKVLIICNPGIDKNFKKEIYDFTKEGASKSYQNINLQCTGKDYDLGADSIYLTKNQRIKEVKKMINSYYEFIGYIKFANIIRKKTNNWDGEEDAINDKIKRFISREFDDRVIIIDEIQNIKTAKKDKLEKTIQSMLMSIIKYGKNIKLILMSATPMFDRADEIIFYLNLLLENDKRKHINKNDIFHGNGTLKTGSEELLKKVLTGYVSYIRAEKPYVFPFKLYPKEARVPNVVYSFNGLPIDKQKKIKHSKIMNIKMNNIQNNTYIHYFNEKIRKKLIRNINENDINEDNINNEKKKHIYHFDLTDISNIVYPKLEKKKLSSIGSFGKETLDYSQDNGKAGYVKNIKYSSSRKKKVTYSYQSHAIFNKNTINETPFADEKNIKEYSSKFDHVLKAIKHSKGLVFIFSNFIDQGVLPLALALEQNGFSRHCVSGEESLLEYSPNKKGGGGKRKPVCYLCGNELTNKIHQDKKESDYHVFLRAKYMIFFGEPRDIIRIKKEEAVSTFSHKNNKYGQEVKIFIGTSAVSEGLDFKNIRQVHILDPWYNLSKHSQIIGRAIRKNSHIGLPPEEQNVEVYEYASVIDSKTKLGETESIDLRNYRIAENKDVIIKKINRVMKESSVDCVLFKKANVILNKNKVKQITPNGETVNVQLGDSPYSSICDYYENCDFKCNWTPNPKINYPINNDTFKISSGRNNIQKCRRIILRMYQENNAYHQNNFKEEIRKNYHDMNELFIYSALEEFVNNKNEIVLDKFNIKGYIIYRGDYYIFQPLDMEDTKMPLEYRMNPMSIKRKNVNIEDYDFDYPKENVSNNNNQKYSDLYDIIINHINHNLKEKKFMLSNKEKKNKYYESAVYGTVLDKINIKEDYIFIEIVLKKYYLGEDSVHIQHIIDYYIQRNVLINYHQDIKYDKSKINNNIFVGFISYDTLYVIKEINNNIPLKDIKFGENKFEKANEDIKSRILRYRKTYMMNKNNKIFDYSSIYGTLGISKNKRIFKIIDNSEKKKIKTQKETLSQRDKPRGIVCTFKKKEPLMEVYKKLGIKIQKLSKDRIDDICTIIEIYLRFMQYINKDNKTWFVYE